jgi:hypothetical protein
LTSASAPYSCYHCYDHGYKEGGRSASRKCTIFYYCEKTRYERYYVSARERELLTCELPRIPVLRLSEKPHERANRLTIRRLIATT